MTKLHLYALCKEGPHLVNGRAIVEGVIHFIQVSVRGLAMPLLAVAGPVCLHWGIPTRFASPGSLVRVCVSHLKYTPCYGCYMIFLVERLDEQRAEE